MSFFTILNPLTLSGDIFLSSNLFLSASSLNFLLFSSVLFTYIQFLSLTESSAYESQDSDPPICLTMPQLYFGAIIRNVMPQILHGKWRPRSDTQCMAHKAECTCIFLLLSSSSPLAGKRCLKIIWDEKVPSTSMHDTRHCSRELETLVSMVLISLI